MRSARKTGGPLTVLLIDSDAAYAASVADYLRDRLDVHTVPDAFQALDHFQARAYDAVLLDVELAGVTDGLELLRQLRQIDRLVPVLLVTSGERTDVALAAGRLGASDYFTKGVSLDVLARRLLTVLEGRASERHRDALERDAKDAHWEFVGESDAIQRLIKDAVTVSAVGSPILLTGEHGTGKDVLARYIHRHSPRADHPFVPVNCAAIPEGIFESEIFGHERGAFTGASQARRGSFEIAGAGTLLLDEITEMPMQLQPKLLRALQSGEYSRIGSERIQQAHARVICATNRDPLQAIEAQRLRQDLYYRINVVHLHIPALRERREDIPVLARHFLRIKSRELGKQVDSIAPEAEALLMAHDWPGNARELENLIERALVFCRASRIGPELMSPISEGAAFLALPWEQARDLAMRRFARSYLTALLHVYAGSVSRAARAMGVSRQAFYKALDRAGLTAEPFRRPANRG
ncbi:MAG: sigma-54-dependent Fis family transcriptional regulator [Candidatus Eisenbacteria sp.]|nr:sigma-54-dependent Fis family transcriptional regulator [Candidatus Eisenbacteria bacterium]